MQTARLHSLLLIPLLLLTILVAYGRNPIALSYPVMFTEDGTWTALFYTDGIWRAYWAARPDYFVAANIGMLHAASLIATVTGLGLGHSPEVIAALSYVFYGLVTALPMVALRRDLPVWGRLLVVVAIALVPVGVPDSSGEIWGRASNIGFAFAYLAPIAIIWREAALSDDHRAEAAVADLLLLLSLATNPLTIPMVGLYAMFRLVRLWRRAGVRPAADAVFLLASGLIVLCICRSMFMPPPSGIRAALTFDGFVLSAVARSLLYPFLFAVYTRLTTASGLLAGLCLALLLLAGWRACRRPQVFGLFVLALLLVTVATVVQRPDLYVHLGGYVGSYPDRYFYAQNLMVLTAVIWACVSLVQTPHGRRLTRFAGGVLLAGLVALYATHWDDIVRPGHVPCPESGGSFPAQLAAAKPHPLRPDRVIVEICGRNWTMELPADAVE